MDERTRVSVDIYGINYRLMGNTSSEYMKKVAEYVDRQMRAVAGGYPRLDLPRIAVLSAVNIADELFKAMQVLEEAQKSPGIDDLRRQVQALEREREQLQRLNQEQKLQLEAGKQREKQLEQDKLALQNEYEAAMRRAESLNEAAAADAGSVQEAYRKLKEEYQKLQNEYNEWIELMEQDQPGGE